MTQPEQKHEEPSGWAWWSTYNSRMPETRNHQSKLTTYTSQVGELILVKLVNSRSKWEILCQSIRWKTMRKTPDINMGILHIHAHTPIPVHLHIYLCIHLHIYHTLGEGGGGLEKARGEKRKTRKYRNQSSSPWCHNPTLWPSTIVTLDSFNVIQRPTSGFCVEGFSLFVISGCLSLLYTKGLGLLLVSLCFFGWLVAFVRLGIELRDLCMLSELSTTEWQLRPLQASKPHKPKLEEILFKKMNLAWLGGSHLKSQHQGGGVSQDQKFKARLNYVVRLSHKIKAQTDKRTCGSRSKRQVDRNTLLPCW